MIEIKNIVVPFDFSKRCRAAAGHAVALAQRFRAPMTLLHVIPYSSFEYAAFEGGSYVGSVWPSEQEVLARLTKELSELPAPDELKKTCKLVVLKGEPPLRISDFTTQLEAPLVVMPTHGHGAFRRFVLGSVTTKVLHDLTCPILTGAHLEDQPHFAGEKYDRIACAVDLTEHSEHTLRFAVDFAKAWDATLTVVHASTWLVGADMDDGLLPEAMRKRLLDTSKGEAVALLRTVGCDADLRVGLGRPEDVVPNTLREISADMLIVGRRTGKDGGGLGPHGHDLIRSSPCPVLSV
jgi:nucleotide-binding universal stress UspA family protein